MRTWDGSIVASGQSFRPVVRTTEFPSSDEIPIFKTLPMMELLRDHFAVAKPMRIVEIGMFQGGSTALLAALAPEATILAIDDQAGPAAMLTRYEQQGGSVANVHAVYGADQGDRDQMRALVDEVFGGEPIDFVLDDASHELERSRVTMEVLTPHLRPGGCYMLEDWGWSHQRATELGAGVDESYWPAGPPLTHLLYQVLATIASLTRVFDRIDADCEIATLWRGDRELDPDTFRLADVALGEVPYTP